MGFLNFINIIFLIVFRVSLSALILIYLTVDRKFGIELIALENKSHLDSWFKITTIIPKNLQILRALAWRVKPFKLPFYILIYKSK